MVEDIILSRINEFQDFYDLLIKKSPKGYQPWFFPCSKKGKDPCPEAILKIDSSSKGSWHHASARLTKEQCIQHLKEGYNLGISARKEDPLIIGDIDEEKYLKQIPENVLTVTSRKRGGAHFFGWDKDGSAKLNIPTDEGELRSDNQYVLACGSYVPFDLENEKDKKAFEELSSKAREDPLMGHYTLRNKVPPRELCFEDLPRLYKDKIKLDVLADAKIKQRNEAKSYETQGKYTGLFNLKMSDVIGAIPSNKRVGHPLHESDTDANWSLSKDGNIGHCWRHMVSLNPVQYLCVRGGYSKCVDAGTPHKGRGLSKIQGDKKAYLVAYNEAVKMKLIKPSSSASAVFTKKEQAKIFDEKQPIFFDKSMMFWLWNTEKCFWEISDDIDVLNLVEEQTGRDIISPKNRVEILNSLKQEGRKNIPKDFKPNWIQFKDKIYDIETGESFEASPEYFATNPIDWEVSHDPSTPNMDRIFKEWVGGDYVETLYQIIAYSMLSDYPIHRLFCLIGSGLNGKSCFLKLLKKFIGHENTASTELDRLMSSRFEVTRLHKKLLCLMGETNFTEMKQTAMIKSLTGQDEIPFEYKNRTPFSGENYAKLIIATNNLPSTTDKTEGWYRRWMIIDFPNKFNEKKDILLDIPLEEYNNLATRCLLCLKNLLQAREFAKEGTIEERMKRYEDRSDPIGKFIAEFTTEDYNSYIFKFDFEKRLNQWCEENRFRKIAESTIGRKMKQKGIEVGRREADWLKEGVGNRLRCWEGVKWKE